MSVTKKIISLILTAVMLVITCSAAFPVFAEGSLLADGVNEDEFYLPEEGDAEAYILSEVTEKREENAKHFLMSDGSFMVAQYNEPVHELDNDGNWIDIDNTIAEAEATTEQTELFGTDELYSTSNITDNVVFAEKSNSNTLVSYEAKEHPISFNYQSAKKSCINVVDNETVLEGDDAFLSLPDITQEVVYEDVFADVDLQYIVSPTGLKENIILKSKSAQNSFTVNYNIGELTAEVVDSNTINLMAGDEVVYTISAPYMTDANGEKSEAVTLTVEKNKNGKLRIKISADESWLSAEDRAYPVVVDPTITTETTRDVIDSVMIAEAQPNKNYSEQTEMIVGRESFVYGYCRVLVKVQLPTLNKGDVIVGAQLNILNNGFDYFDNSTPDMQVNAHALTEDWSVSTVKWSNQPSYNSTVLDYDVFEKTDYATWRKFDITKIAKQWYEEPDTNYGIMLKGANTTGTYAENGVKAYMYTERYNDIDDAYPQILLTYRNNKGLENYWTYTSLSAGAAGSAYVNDYTGNLVFASNIISSSNELMPLSVDCVYNGYISHDTYVSGKIIDGIRSSQTSPGRGWKLSVQQTVLPSSLYGLTGDAAENYPYVYTDGDGTEHYIYKKTESDKTSYEDEDGLGLTLTVQKSGSTVTGYTLTDKKDNKLIFNSQGNLTKSQDANGNYITVTYENDGKRIKSMTDGAGKKYTITYIDGMNYIDYITDPSSRKVDFDYSQGRLTKIVHTDGTVSNFTYDDTEYSMLTAKDNDGYQLNFEYTSVDKGKRVSAVTEYGNGVEGQKISFNRLKYNTTTIRTAGSDGVYGNSNDLVTTYQFDNFGRTVTYQLRTQGGADSVAGVYNYTEKDASVLKSANKVSLSASLGKNVVNYVASSNAESFSGWTSSSDENVTSTIGTSTDAAYIGQKSIRVNNTEASVGGNANAYQNISGLEESTKYTFSAYVKTENLSLCNDTSAGAYVCVRVKQTDGTYSYTYSDYITDNTPTAIDKGFRRISSTVTLPAGTTSVRVYFGLRNSTGKAYFDCMQLEKGSVVNDYNLISNSSFENETSGMPDSWSKTSNITYTASDTTVYEGISSKYAKDGSKSMVIKGDADENKYLSQYAYVYGDPDDTYIVSAWARANAVGDGENHSNERFRIAVKVYYKTETGESYSEYKEPANFNTTISGWQYTAQTFTLRSKDHPTYQPVSVRLIPQYSYQVNYAYFDHIQLIKDVAQSYTYDSEGNVVSVSANAEQKDNMEYDGEDNLKTYTDVLGNETKYTYDSKHNVTEVQSPGGMKSEYTYQSNGNQMYADIKNSDESIVIRSGALYNEADSESGVKAGAYTRVTSDQNLNRTYYDYDLLRGTLTSVTNARGYITTYSYDNYDRLKTVSSGDTSVSYSYDGNRLKSITYGTDVYSFVYDNYGNVVSTKVNGKALSTNTYGANNGVLKSTTYGNGDARQYTYDSYGNLRIIENGSGTNLYSWHYDSSMTPLMHQDAVNDNEYHYSYDSIGRLIRQDITAFRSDDYIGATQFTYDLRNNVTKISNNMGGRTVSQFYKYTAIDGIDATVRYAKDNLPTRYIISSDRYVDYSYDSINRLNRKVISTVSPLVSSYTYKTSARNEEGQTLYRTTQISTEHSGKIAYYYTYDELGNITQINRANSDGSGSVTGSWSTNYRSYEYDDLNQLIRENNKTTNNTYVYEYDNYGNIVSKTVYPYSTGSLGTATRTINYTYGADANAGWKNILTKYNGETITYDAIGNPTKYRGATLGWETRQLKSYSKNGTNITYKYDADGLRASKTVNGAKTTYQYVDGQLLYEDRNGTDIYYYYDSYGTPTAIRYYEPDGTTYRFVIGTNSLGDVNAIYNMSGELVVKYEYDAWGNIISETNATGGTPTSLAQYWSEINPFRYRGYYYDADTGLYYLQSRYYDAETGRFLNSDVLLDTSDILGFNPFAYCLNNPILYVDYSGALCAIHAGGGGMPTNNTTKNTTNNTTNNTANALDKTIDVATSTYIQRSNMEINTSIYQLKMIKGIFKNWYDNFGFSMQLKTDQARQQASFEQKIIVDRFSTPEKAANTFAVFSVSFEALAKCIVKVSPKTAAVLEGVAIFCGAVSVAFNIISEG